MYFWIFFIFVGNACGTDDTEGGATDFNVGETCDSTAWDPESLLQIEARSAVQAETKDAATDKSKKMKHVEVLSIPRSKTHAMPKIFLSNSANAWLLLHM